ncbi:hypothetical protein [Streptomyces sp. NPDC004284]|uniref:hypothetical protein n=1 Tax=Streptomyces sp. NPDC004284 TaxID=3364695 RepID=UPI0036A6077D
MRLDGGEGDVQVGRQFLVGTAVGDQSHDVRLAGGERGFGRRRAGARRVRRRPAGMAAVAGQQGAVISVPWATLLALFAGAGVVGALAVLGPGMRASAAAVTRAVGGEVG